MVISDEAMTPVAASSGMMVTGEARSSFSRVASTQVAADWLAIDPKPHVGDPAYDPVQHMLNCDQRLATDHQPRYPV